MGFDFPSSSWFGECSDLVVVGVAVVVVGAAVAVAADDNAAVGRVADGVGVGYNPRTFVAYLLFLVVVVVAGPCGKLSRIYFF